MAVDIRPSLNRALKQLHTERSRIDRQISALTDALGAIGGGAVRRARRAAKRSVKRARRKMTAAQRKAVSRRMKAFWAKKRKTKAS